MRRGQSGFGRAERVRHARRTALSAVSARSIRRDGVAEPPLRAILFGGFAIPLESRIGVAQFFRSGGENIGEHGLSIGRTRLGGAPRPRARRVIIGGSRLNRTRTAPRLAQPRPAADRRDGAGRGGTAHAHDRPRRRDDTSAQPRPVGASCRCPRDSARRQRKPLPRRPPRPPPRTARSARSGAASERRSARARARFGEQRREAIKGFGE